MDQEQAHEILETAHNAFISIDHRGRITHWNHAATVMFGRSAAEVRGLDLADTIIPEHLREAHRSGLNRYLETGQGVVFGKRLELSALSVSGEEFPVELTITALAGEQPSFHAFVHDCSDKRASEQERQRLLAELEQALQSSERRLHAIVDALADSVTIRDHDDRIVYANSAALEQLGFDTLEQLRAAPLSSIMDEYLVLGEDGGEVRMEDIPSVRLLHGERAEPLLIHTIRKGSGEESWRLLKASGLRSPSGELEAAVTIIEDVTVSKQAELRMRFLARSSEILSSSLDYTETLQNVAQLAVPEVADWCAVDLLDDSGSREPVAVAHSDPSKLELATLLRRYEPSELDPGQGVGAAVSTGESQLYAEIPDQLLAGAAQDPEHLRLLRAVGMRSVLIVPMRTGGRTIGVLSLVNAESGRRFAAGDVEFAEAIAHRAAVAVENSRLYTERSRTAATLQRSLLPALLPQIPGWALAALYRPAGPEATVGGDFYDAFPVRGGWLVLIGDVTGKGVEAAAVTALLRHSARIIGEDQPEPALVLSRLSSRLRAEPGLSISTALCLRLGHDGSLTFSSGGHPLPLLVRPGRVREVGEPGTVLGAFDEGEWQDIPVELERRETLLLYTDGVTDTVGVRERFGSERLNELLSGCEEPDPAELLNCMDTGLSRFQVGGPADDTAALALRRED